MFLLKADCQDADGWELINDDGFVHKRKKRPRLDLAVAYHPLDPTAGRRYRRQRKKRALAKLRSKYLQEISRWELLSKKLKETQQEAMTCSLKCQDLETTTSSDEVLSSEQRCTSDSARHRVVDNLLSRVQVQEALIKRFSDLCDVAEALLNSQEDRLKQQFCDLPIWESSPRHLMAELCEK
ncbi:uncharacterized protein LOC127240528 [Andrographis paniculata]|uniref:uncharacterized protein LOC127240528 n=1 Tax=Andrographis paniculata TaxID=175694 RepID=UPI0021E7828C|nr:uncharacterized protein LOC127240528 [Andrographis paniculata]